MANRIGTYIRILLTATFALAAVVSSSEAEAQFHRLVIAIPPAKPYPKTQAQKQAEEKKRLEAFASCQACATKTPGASPFLQAPKKIPNSAFPMGPVDPQKMNAWQVEAWRDFWGLKSKLPKKNYLRWGRYTTAYTRESLGKLNKVAMVNVMEPRGQNRRRKIGGDRAKGMCYQAVKETLRDGGIVKEYIPGEPAMGAAKYFAKQKYPNGTPMFADITKDLKADAAKTPPGAIIVYRGGRFGHIELKIKNQYCSDHCNAVPMNQKISRYVLGIFLPLAQPGT